MILTRRSALGFTLGSTLGGLAAKKFYDDQMAFWDPIIKQSGAKPE